MPRHDWITAPIGLSSKSAGTVSTAGTSLVSFGFCIIVIVLAFLVATGGAGGARGLELSPLTGPPLASEAAAAAIAAFDCLVDPLPADSCLVVGYCTCYCFCCARETRLRSYSICRVD